MLILFTCKMGSSCSPGQSTSSVTMEFAGGRTVRIPSRRSATVNGLIFTANGLQKPLFSRFVLLKPRHVQSIAQLQRRWVRQRRKRPGNILIGSPFTPEKVQFTVRQYRHCRQRRGRFPEEQQPVCIERDIPVNRRRMPTGIFHG